MKYSCAGLVESSTPLSTRPGWVRQAGSVDVTSGVNDGVLVGVEVGVEVGGTGVHVGAGGFDGVQAVTMMRSIKSVAIHFVRRIAALIA